MELFGKHIGIIEAVVKGKKVTLGRGELREIDVLLKAYAREATPELRSFLNRVRRDLQDPKVFEQYGIRIEEVAGR